jgi:hypothetical protein
MCFRGLPHVILFQSYWCDYCYLLIEITLKIRALLPKLRTDKNQKDIEEYDNSLILTILTTLGIMVTGMYHGSNA